MILCPALAGKLKVLPAVDITPTMTCRVRMIQVSAILRVSLAPVLPDLPFVGAVSLSLMTPPYLDFDLRCALHYDWPVWTGCIKRQVAFSPTALLCRD